MLSIHIKITLYLDFKVNNTTAVFHVQFKQIKPYKFNYTITYLFKSCTKVFMVFLFKIKVFKS